MEMCEISFKMPYHKYDFGKNSMGNSTDNTSWDKGWKLHSVYVYFRSILKCNPGYHHPDNPYTGAYGITS